MTDNRAIIADLARAKAAFQLRAIVAAMGLPIPRKVELAVMGLQATPQAAKE